MSPEVVPRERGTRVGVLGTFVGVDVTVEKLHRVRLATKSAQTFSQSRAVSDLRCHVTIRLGLQSRARYEAERPENISVQKRNRSEFTGRSSFPDWIVVIAGDSACLLPGRLGFLQVVLK